MVYYVATRLWLGSFDNNVILGVSCIKPSYMKLDRWTWYNLDKYDQNELWHIMLIFALDK